MSTTVGELNVKLNLELARLDGQIQDANKKISTMSQRMHGDIQKAAKAITGSLEAIGISFSFAAVLEFGKSLVELGKQVTDFSVEANMTPRAFQLISASAMAADISMEEVARASEHMRSQLQDATTNGAAPLNDALKKFHLTAAGIRGLRPEDQWAVFGTVLEKATDKQAAMNLVSDVFGSKIGPKLRGTLADIAKGLDSIDPRGLVIPDDQLKRLDEFGVKWKEIQLKGEVAAVGFLDSWRDTFKQMGELADKFVKKNFTIRKGGFIDELTRDPRQDINHRANLLPGGVAQFAPRGPSRAEQLQTQMDAAAKKAREDALKADPLLPLREDKAKKEKLNEALGLMFDDIDEISKANPFKEMKSANGIDTGPTDAFSRLGWVTGQVTNPEIKTQTGILKSIHDVLERINSGVRGAEAGFAN